MTSLMWPSCSASAFAAKFGRVSTSSISPNPAVAALEMLAGGIRPQLMATLADINMPGMDGLTLLRDIKERWPELPVMMVTAYGDDERRRQAGAHGAAEFITKPVDFTFLKEQLQRLPGPPA